MFQPQHPTVSEDEYHFGDSGWKLPSELRNVKVPSQSVADETDLPSASDLGIDWFLSLPKTLKTSLPSTPEMAETIRRKTDEAIDESLDVDSFVFTPYRPLDDKELPSLSTPIHNIRANSNHPFSTDQQPSLTENRAPPKQTPRSQPTTPRAPPRQANPAKRPSQLQQPPPKPP